MIVLKIFLWLLIVLFIILIMPIKYIYDMKINTKFEIYLCVKYFFGAIKYEYPNNKLKILGISIIENIKANTRPNKKKSLKTKTKKSKINKPKHTKKVNKKIDLYSYNNIYFFIITGLKFIADIKKKLWPKKIIIKGEIGFDDPAHTGYLCAFDNLIRQFINLELKYNFNKKITQLDIFLSGKICLLNLIFILINRMIDKSVISFIRSNYFVDSSQNKN